MTKSTQSIHRERLIAQRAKHKEMLKACVPFFDRRRIKRILDL